MQYITSSDSKVVRTYKEGHATGHGNYNKGVSIYIFTGISDSRQNNFKARIFEVIADLNSGQLYMITGKT